MAQAAIITALLVTGAVSPWRAVLAPVWWRLGFCSGLRTGIRDIWLIKSSFDQPFWVMGFGVPYLSVLSVSQAISCYLHPWMLHLTAIWDVSTNPSNRYSAPDPRPRRSHSQSEAEFNVKATSKARKAQKPSAEGVSKDSRDGLLKILKILEVCREGTWDGPGGSGSPLRKHQVLPSFLNLI